MTTGGMFQAQLSTGLHDVVNGDKGIMGFRSPHPTIYVKRHRGQAELDTWVHETLHASLPDATEEDVARIARDVALVLWQAGYRRAR